MSYLQIQPVTAEDVNGVVTPGVESSVTAPSVCVCSLNLSRDTAATCFLFACFHLSPPVISHVQPHSTRAVAQHCTARRASHQLRSRTSLSRPTPEEKECHKADETQPVIVPVRASMLTILC